MIQDKTQNLTRCPLCEANYDLQDASVLSEADGSSLLYFSCRQCKIRILAEADGETLSWAITDLNQRDIEAFMESSDIVSPDDVLDIHLLMNKDRHALIDAIIEKI